MKQIYDPEKHEALLMYWWLQLKAEPEEMDKLFIPEDRALTTLLWWANHDVQIGFDSDNDGLTMIAWVQPMMSGAFFGGWCRKDKRHTKAAYRFTQEMHDAALAKYPVIMAVTKQPDLRRYLLHLGYVFTGTIPALYGGSPAHVYAMTSESRIRASKHGQEFRQEQ